MDKTPAYEHCYTDEESTKKFFGKWDTKVTCKRRLHVINSIFGAVSGIIENYDINIQELMIEDNTFREFINKAFLRLENWPISDVSMMEQFGRAILYCTCKDDDNVAIAGNYSTMYFYFRVCHTAERKKNYRREKWIYDMFMFCRKNPSMDFFRDIPSKITNYLYHYYSLMKNILKFKGYVLKMDNIRD